MARPTIKELCGLDTHTLIGLPIEIATKTIIDALKDKKKELAIELHQAYTNSHNDHECVSALNYHIKYLDKAIEARTQDYEEMMFVGEVEQVSEEVCSPCAILGFVKNILNKGGFREQRR